MATKKTTTRTSDEEVAHLLRENRFLLRLLIGVVIVTLAIMNVVGLVANRSATNAKKVGDQNNIFLSNFSDYMRCLVVNDDNVVVQVGIEEYFNLCDDLLFRGTGREHTVTKVTIPPKPGEPTTTTSITDPFATETTRPKAGGPQP